MFMYLAYKGIRSCVKHGHDTVFRVAYFGYFLVGTGSFMFHTTLRYPWQLFDELNMIYTTCLMVYVGLSYRKTPSTQVTLAVGVVAFCIFVTAYYHYLQDPTFHQNVYAALTVFIVFKSIYDMEYTLRPSLRKTRESDRVLKQRYCLPVPTKEQQKYENERDIDILKDMWILVGWGVSIFLGGFVIWGFDRVACMQLRVTRREIGLPYGILLEGHGWWHVMTGIGAYCYIVWGIWLRHVLNSNQEQYKLSWPHLYSLPEIVKTESTSREPGNGPSKKTS
jgi:dihydroceramidase